MNRTFRYWVDTLIKVAAIAVPALWVGVLTQRAADRGNDAPSAPAIPAPAPTPAPIVGPQPTFTATPAPNPVPVPRSAPTPAPTPVYLPAPAVTAAPVPVPVPVPVYIPAPAPAPPPVAANPCEISRRVPTGLTNGDTKWVGRGCREQFLGGAVAVAYLGLDGGRLPVLEATAEGVTQRLSFGYRGQLGGIGHYAISVVDEMGDASVAISVTELR